MTAQEIIEAKGTPHRYVTGMPQPGWTLYDEGLTDEEREIMEQEHGPSRMMGESDAAGWSGDSEESD